MNTFRRWLAARSRPQQVQTDELRDRLDALIGRLESRLRSKFISEFASVGEWELAIDEIWQEVEDGALVLSAADHDELTALTRHPSVNRHILTAGKNHVIDADIRDAD